VNPTRRGGSTERGAVLVFFAIVVTVVLSMAAIVIDLGQARATARIDQKVVDLAALAAGADLGQGNPTAACRAAISYLNSNLRLSSPIDVNGFCAQPGNDIAQTTCSKGPLVEAQPTATVGNTTVSLHYPVPSSEITDPIVAGGTHINDGVACQRMRLIVTAVDHPLFGGVVGRSTLPTTRSATVRPSTVKLNKIPALWLLDPTGCTSLSVTGGSQLTLGATSPTVIPGVVSVDSDGSKCSSNQDTISATGSGTKLTAVPTSGTLPGTINLFALPASASSCQDPACNVADVTSGRISPQPIAQSARATRAPVDWTYNCKTGYPTYHGIAIPDCPVAGTVPAYVDLMRAAIRTSGAPDATYQRWTLTHPCNPSGTVTAPGNWWVDCPGGFTVGNGSNVTFSGGNVVFDGGLSMSGSGSLTFNNANPASNLPTQCLPSTVTTPCIDSSSTGASFIYVRAGDWNLTGGTLAIDHATVYQNSGFVKIAGGAPPVWLGSTEGPFAGLGLWSEASSNKFQINGGAGVQLAGVFFTPEAAPFSLSGGGDWGQQHAQFISYQMAVSGGSVITMAPDAQNFVRPPTRAGTLIR
jgi:hypothetical protein